MKILVLGHNELYKAAADLFVERANKSIESEGRFSVALAGGKTPEPMYEILARDYAHSLDWDHIHAFFSDERCVPPDDPDSNFGMINEALLSKVSIPSENIHRMRGEIESAQAADEYDQEIREFFSLEPSEYPKFDLMMLGMGADGHIASIFPYSDAIHITDRLVAAVYVPKLALYRLTLTPPVIQIAPHTMLMVIDQDKADALAEVFEGDFHPEEFPAQLLRESQGEVLWFVDQSAASGLTNLQKWALERPPVAN